MNIFEDLIVQEVDVCDLLGAVLASVDCNSMEWDFPDMLDNKLSDVMRWNPELIDAVENNQLDNPIIICVNGVRPYGDKHDWIVGNGNHRLAAAWALMQETIPVCFTEDREDYMMSRYFGD